MDNEHDDRAVHQLCGGRPKAEIVKDDVHAAVRQLLRVYTREALLAALERVADA